MLPKLPYAGGTNGIDTHDTNRPDNDIKSFNSPYGERNVGHRWRRFYVWTCGYVILEDFDPSTVSGNPVYQCRICENNNDLPFAANDRRWSSR